MQGVCIEGAAFPSGIDYGDPVVTFGEDHIYGCTQNLNLAEL